LVELMLFLQICSRDFDLGGGAFATRVFELSSFRFDGPQSYGASPALLAAPVE
jgi:hypothetical protein